jgi:hypothetical protein
MDGKMKKIHFPKTRFSELAARKGGVVREIAVEEALNSIEASRGESDAVIETSIAAIEAIAYPADGKLSAPQMREILRLADQIVTLAGLFRYHDLDTAARSLCDLTDGLLNAGLSDAAPVIVHAQALRLMAPGSALLATPQEAKRILDGLKRILDHFNFASLSSMHGAAEIEDTAFEVG